MAEFRWIKTSLFVILVLQFTAKATGQLSPSFTVRDEDEVTLPCDTKIDDHKNCNSTIWFFSYSGNIPSVVLVQDGKIDDDAAKDKSDRLSVSETCSLVIKNVTGEDRGRYLCRQVRPGQLVHGDVVLLSVVTMTEHKDTDEVTVTCSVSAYKPCRHTVKWLLEGSDNRNITTSQSLCLATASFSTSHFIPMNSELMKCEVTDPHNREVKVFPFSPPQSSGEDATTTAATTTRATTTTADTTTRATPTAATTTAETTKTTTTTPEGGSVLNSWILVLEVAGLLLMTVIVVLLIRARGNRRTPDRNTVHGDGDGHGGFVNFENVEEPSVSVQLP